MTLETKTVRYIAAVFALLIGFGWGCSVDSPTTPVQQPQLPPGSEPASGTWNITVRAEFESIFAGTTTRVDVDVQAPDGSRPQNGALLQMTANRGSFVREDGFAAREVFLRLNNGRGASTFQAISIGGEPLSGEFRLFAVYQDTRRMEVVNAFDQVTAGFSFIVADKTVVFTNTSTGAAVSFNWDFGDGSSSRAVHPTHTYEEPGDYAVTLTAFGPSGAVASVVTQLVTIEEEEMIAP